MTVAPFGSESRLALRAAGFMATSTLGVSPGVEMSWSEMWTWKAETPASVPAGARISAGKSGKVARSFPSSADVVVKRSPASCMPSPESPANRMTTRSSSWGDFGSVVVSDTMLLRADLLRSVAGLELGAAYDLRVLARMNTPDPGFGVTVAVYRPTRCVRGVAGRSGGRPVGRRRALDQAVGQALSQVWVRRW